MLGGDVVLQLLLYDERIVDHRIQQLRVVDVHDIRAGCRSHLVEARGVGMEVPLRELFLHIERLHRRDIEVELPPTRRGGERGLASARNDRHAVRAAELKASLPVVRPRRRRLVAVRPIRNQRTMVRAATELDVQARLRTARPIAVVATVLPVPRICLRSLPAVAPHVSRAHQVLRGIRRVLRYEPHVLHLLIPFCRHLHDISHKPVKLHPPPHVNLVGRAPRARRFLAVVRLLSSFHPPRDMPLRLPPLRLALHKRSRANLKLALLRHDHKPHRLLQHFASIDLDGRREPALRERQRLFRRDHPARLTIKRHRLVRFRGRVAFADARIEPPETRMPPQLAVAVVARRLVRHRNRKRNLALCHPLRRNRRRAAIHARCGIWRNHHAAPERLHAVRGNVERDVHRLAVPVHALGIEAGDRRCRNLRRSRGDRPTTGATGILPVEITGTTGVSPVDTFPHEVRELHLHAF